MALLPLLFILSFLSIPAFSLSQAPHLRGYLIDCGATVQSEIEGLRWLPDDGFVFSGTSKNLSTAVIVQNLSTVRSFPNLLNHKFCYVVPAIRGRKYMLRTTYFYGGINGRDSPPVFDQIVDGTFWSVVNTTEDYANGLLTYYEGVFEAQARTINFCVGSNTYTDSDPFISALEVVLFENSCYNSTDFRNYSLSSVARHNFGSRGPVIRYPEDQFNRFWEPFGEDNSTIVTNTTVSVSGIWNLPPSKVFETKLTSGPGEPLELNWPPVSLPSSRYYIALYFASDNDSSQDSSRMFNISVNGVTYYRNLDVTPEGLVVFATMWPLGGFTRITLTPAAGSNLAPLINGGEVFEVLALGGRTLARDAVAMERLRDGFENPPIDWTGDPCLPRQYSWTGVTCSEGPRIRVITVNLTNMDLSGSLSPSIANMTALSTILLGNNNLSGPIPGLSTLRMLQILHLEDNQFSGEIPPSLGDLPNLRELFLQNNNLTGQVPSGLTRKSGLTLRTSPGNNLSSPPPS